MGGEVAAVGNRDNEIVAAMDDVDRWSDVDEVKTPVASEGYEVVGVATQVLLRSFAERSENDVGHRGFGGEVNVVFGERTFEQAHRRRERVLSHRRRELGHLGTKSCRIGVGEIEEGSFSDVVETEIFDRCEPCDDAHRDDSVGMAGGGCERMWAPGRPTNDRGAVDPEVVEQFHDIGGEVDHSPSRVRGRGPVARPIDGHESDAGGRERRSENAVGAAFESGPWCAMEVHDWAAIRGATFGECEAPSIAEDHA